MSNMYNECQEGLVKALIADPEKLTDVARVISLDDFEDVNYSLVYESIRELKHSEKKISLPDIVATINKNHPEAHVDPIWILDLDNDLTKWIAKAPAMTWAKLLKKESARSKTEKILKNALNNIDKENPVDIIGSTSSLMEEVAMDALEDNEVNNEQRLDRYKEYMKTRLDFKKNVIPSPYPSVDKYIVGWLPGQLITIGARTSVGKSVIATQSAIAACVSNKSVQIFSLEMSEFEVIDRMLCAMSNVELSALRTRRLSQEEQERFENAQRRFANFKLSIDENPSVTIDYIKNKAIRQAQSAEGLDMIIIDYLQLVTHDKRGATREQIVAEMSREMKKLAKQLQVPVMILAQLNREGKDDPEDRLPQISDIRESGAIAADSDVILLIHRKLVSDEIDPKALFIIGKNRNGQPGKKISVRCSLEYAKFVDDGIEETYDEARQVADNEHQESINEQINQYEAQAPDPDAGMNFSEFSQDAFSDDESPFGDSPFGESSFDNNIFNNEGDDF